jgi:hypothetical protein
MLWQQKHVLQKPQQQRQKLPALLLQLLLPAWLQPRLHRGSSPLQLIR